MNKLMQIFEWIYRLLYINALWMLFTIAGLLIFGLFPSTASMFYLIREWLYGKKDIPIFKTFAAKYKEEFFRAQIYGLLAVAVAALAYFNIQFFLQKEETIFYLMRYIVVMIGLIVAIMLPYVFPLFVIKRVTIGEFFKNVLIISVTRIIHSVIMVIGCFTIFIVFSRFSGLFIFFLGSTTALWLTWNTEIVLRKLQLVPASSSKSI